MEEKVNISHISSCFEEFFLEYVKIEKKNEKSGENWEYEKFYSLLKHKQIPQSKLHFWVGVQGYEKNEKLLCTEQWGIKDEKRVLIEDERRCLHFFYALLQSAHVYVFFLVGVVSWDDKKTFCNSSNLRFRLIFILLIIILTMSELSE